MIRIVFLVLAVAFMLMGVTTYQRGEPDYQNYLRGPIPWWLPILASGLLIWGAINPDFLNDMKKRKETPKVRRKRLKAQKVREPIDDFDKPWKG
jgi:hypothetical protein